MVKQQQLMKYGRQSAVTLGYVDIVKFAESFGAKGFVIDDITNFESTFSEARSVDGPALIEIPIDYSDNQSLFAKTHDNAFH